MTKWLNPSVSARVGVCLLCQNEASEDNPLHLVVYPPSMEGGLVCDHCYDHNEYLVRDVSVEVTGTYPEQTW